MTAPLIVTAVLGDADFAWLDILRKRHFPPERNHLRAHLTMFHHLPPSVEGELAGRLRALTRQPAPAARVARLLNLGRGVAFAIESEGLSDIRAQLAEAFWDMLTPQDRSPWRAHVTVQNKVEPKDARRLLDQLSAEFEPQAIAISGLALWHYVGGPWSPVGAWRFGQGHGMTAPN